MPIPKWVAKMNKTVFNPREINKGVRPVLTHVGRKSGNTYQTPLDAHAVDGGYIFIANYGPDSDWVQNILSSGTASLRVDGENVELTNPRLIGNDEAWEQLARTTAKEPPSFLNVSDYLWMDTV
ncbi:MAG: nitroreductase family deazaflavin-dependent oxidoreductase [Acidimicrobiia bacterium]